MGELITDRDGTRLTITLNRPDASNALNRTMLEAFADQIRRAESDPEVRVVTVHAAGDKAFCAGADVNELSGLDAAAARAYLLAGGSVMRQLHRSPVPSIAAVHGSAVGGGLELALACSFIVATDDAQFGLPEAGLGLIPGFGGTQRLVQSIGRGPALRMMLTGSRLPVVDAWRLGLLAEPPVSRHELDTRVDSLATAVASSSPSAVALILEAVRGTDPGDERFDHEAALAAIAVGSHDAREGIAAFRERRRATFRGRHEPS